MALEIRRTIPDAHSELILCVAYNPQRRELFSGSQDSTIKVWAAETGEHLRTLSEHTGWVTGLAFSTELRALFSCSIDGRILVWSFKGELVQKERAGGREPGGTEAGRSSSGPLYCLAWDARRSYLVVGGNGHLWLYAAVSDSVDVLAKERPVIKFHSLMRAHCNRGQEEPVRGIIATDSGKLYSVGYDRTLCIWDTDHAAGSQKPGQKKKKGIPGEPSGVGEAMLKRSYPPEKEAVRPCHEGAISCCTFDPDNNWLITGSFDRCVKIWSGDGKKVADINGFSDTLTGLCYVPATKTLWMSSNSPHPLVYDPRTATDITSFLLQTKSSAKQLKDAKERINRLFRINETGEVVATTNTRQLQIWRYNPHGASAILRGHTDWVEVLAYCYKQSESSAEGAYGSEANMTLLSAGSDSVLRKWEPASRMNPALYSNYDHQPGHKGAVLCAIYCNELELFATGGDDGTIRIWPQKEHILSGFPGFADDGEEDDMLAAIGEDSGRFDSDSAGGARRDAPKDAPDVEHVQHKVLCEHTDRVTGLACDGTTLASVSWDLSLRLWNLASHLDAPTLASTHAIENAHDDYLLSVAIAPSLDPPLLATASADNGVKLWNLNADTKEGADPSLRQTEVGSSAFAFAEELARVIPDARESSDVGALVPEGKKGKRLYGQLHGHTADVSHVKWNDVHRVWVTGSEDHSVRLWSADGVQVGEVRPPGDAITALSIDVSHGFILVASIDHAMRVYDVQQERPDEDDEDGVRYKCDLLQQHTGHSDAVRAILHVPEKAQYITASWDHTLRVWRAAGLDKAPAWGRANNGAAAADGKGLNHMSSSLPSEESGKTYAEQHPLEKPKQKPERDRRSAADKFLPYKKSGAEDPKERRKKKTNEEEGKSVTGLSLKLNELEHTLKQGYDRAEKPSSQENQRRGRAGANRTARQGQVDKVAPRGRGGGVSGRAS